jgi:hypothetical protein
LVGLDLGPWRSDSCWIMEAVVFRRHCPCFAIRDPSKFVFWGKYGSSYIQKHRLIFITLISAKSPLCGAYSINKWRLGVSSSYWMFGTELGMSGRLRTLRKIQFCVEKCATTTRVICVWQWKEFESKLKAIGNLGNDRGTARAQFSEVQGSAG